MTSSQRKLLDLKPLSRYTHKMNYLTAKHPGIDSGLDLINSGVGDAFTLSLRDDYWAREEGTA